MPDGFIDGIDVSSNQGQVDWPGVAKTGRAFAFTRATIGGDQADSHFSENWTAIASAGLMRSAYHFFWPLTPWKAQADNFITTVGPLQPGDLPPVLDLEEAIPKSSPLKRDAWNDVPAIQRLGIVQSWLDTVERGVGMRPIIYTRQNFIEALLGSGVDALNTYGLWIAHYQVPQPSIPSSWLSWTFWQHSDKGSVDGVRGEVDCDWFNGSLAALQALRKI